MNIDQIKIALQYALPKHLVSRLVGKLAAAKAGPLTTWLIQGFIKQFGINMAEAQWENASDYKTFNDFFTRPLKAGMRPLTEDASVFVHPVDGCISQLGAINNDQLIQAKEHSYSVHTLLGGDTAISAPFIDGDFACIYLAPKDYHRIHMPIAGTLKTMVYVPGDLFSVNPLTARNVPNLFARNERVVCVFETAIGPMAMVLVGATIVASIETVWAGTVTPPTGPNVHTWHYPTTGTNALHLAKGEEMGRFKLGSTVVLTTVKGALEFLPSETAETVTRMGTPFAKIQQLGK